MCGVTRDGARDARDVTSGALPARDVPRVSVSRSRQPARSPAYVVVTLGLSLLLNGAIFQSGAPRRGARAAGRPSLRAMRVSSFH